MCSAMYIHLMFGVKVFYQVSVYILYIDHRISSLPISVIGEMKGLGQCLSHIERKYWRKVNAFIHVIFTNKTLPQVAAHYKAKTPLVIHVIP